MLCIKPPSCISPYKLNIILPCIILLFGCKNPTSESFISMDTPKSYVNLFVNSNIIVDSCSIIEERYNHPLLNIVKKGSKFGLTNNTKLLVLPFDYDTIIYSHNTNHFIIAKHNLFGVISPRGFLTIPIAYEQIEFEWRNISSFEEISFIVQKDHKLGTINLNNNTIIPIEFDGISNWVEYGPKAHYVKKGNHYGLIDYKTGQLIVPVLYDGIEDHKGIIEIKKNGKYGVLSWKNNVMIPCVYDRLFVDLDFFGLKMNHQDKIFAQKDNRWYEFLLNGTMSGSNIRTSEIDSNYLNMKQDSYEYRYHLKDCMVFPTR